MPTIVQDNSLFEIDRELDFLLDEIQEQATDRTLQALAISHYSRSCFDGASAIKTAPMITRTALADTHN